MTDDSQRSADGLPTDPLASRDAWVALNFGLPSVSLSVVSLLALLTTTTWLTVGARVRSLFELPYPSVALAAPSALLVVYVARECARRPSPPFPRYVLLGVSVVSGVVALLAAAELIADRIPFVAALTLGCAAAALALAPRLLRLRPNDRWLFRLAPLTCLALLIIVPTTALGFTTISERQKQRDTADLIAHLEELRALLHEVAQHDWSGPADAAGRRLVERMTEQSIDDALHEGRSWVVAEILGMDAALTGVFGDVLGELETTAAVTVAPRVSTLEEPTFSWDPEEERWRASPSFPANSAHVAAYHRQVLRWTEALSPTSDGDAPATSAQVAAAERYAETRSRLAASLTERLGSFTDHWVLGTLPDAESWVGDPRLSLERVLSLPLLDGEGTVRPADVWQLLEIRQAEARGVLAAAPGCHARVYLHPRGEFLRVDCHAYEATPGELEARLRVEMRLVYSQAPANSAQSSLPTEVYFLFPIPPGQTPSDYRDLVMNALAAAVRNGWTGGFAAVDTSGSVTSGFRLIRDRQIVIVRRPSQIDDFPTGPAITVRAEWSMR